MDFSSKLLEQMQNAGIYFEGEINWHLNDIQRFCAKNYRRRSSKPIFVVLHSGGASFGDWRDPSTWRTWWERSWRDITREEQEARKLAQAKLDNERRLLRNHAIWRAHEMLKHKTWLGDTCTRAKSFDEDDCTPYVKTKRIVPYYGRQIRSYLVLPITDVDRNLISLQYIKANGRKQFKKHASPKGGMMFLAETITDNDVIRICEGYATGCTIYEAVGAPVVVAFGATNLVAVAVAIRIKYPFNKIVICADNDIHTKDNPGLTYGLKAAQASSAKIIYPTFINSSDKPTDYNDLLCLCGIEEVERQLLGL